MLRDERGQERRWMVWRFKSVKKTKGRLGSRYVTYSYKNRP